MPNVVYVKNYTPPKINVKEVLRYAGVKGEIPEISAIVDECVKELEGKLNYKVCYSEYPVKITGNEIDLSFALVNSKNLAKNLKNCKTYILFCATVGIAMDRLIAKYSVLSPTKGLIFQALGAERIESLCNLFNKEIQGKYKHTRPRFSPGYGDLKVELQREIFAALNCSKNLGVTLNESLLMSPSKSVTAIIGVCDENTCEKNEREEKRGCFNCEKINCAFRK